MADSLGMGEGEYGYCEVTPKNMRGMVRAENTETAVGYQIASGEFTVDGTPQLPLWTVIGPGKTPTRLTSKEVLDALISTYDGDTVGLQTSTQVFVSLLGELNNWVKRFNLGEENLKDSMIYTGYINLDLAECFDTLKELEQEWRPS